MRRTLTALFTALLLTPFLGLSAAYAADSWT